MPGRGWARSTVHDVIQKVRESGTSDRRPGSGRPATAMTEYNKEVVIQRSMSDKERPGTSLSERQMARELGISQSSVGRIKKAMHIKTFTRIICRTLQPFSLNNVSIVCRSFSLSGMVTHAVTSHNLRSGKRKKWIIRVPKCLLQYVPRDRLYLRYLLC
jgi:hypothetical protein